MRPLRVALLATLLGPLLAAAPCLAQAQQPTLRDLTSVRAEGMGGASRGFASSDEALLVNPAAIAGTVRFNFDASALYQPTPNFRVFSASAVDSKINADEGFPLSGGAGYYNYNSGAGDTARSGHLAIIGLALPLVPEQLFIGVAPKYLRLTTADGSTNDFNFDAAVMLKVASLVGISAVGYNLIDLGSLELRRAWGFGVAVGSDLTFHVDVDARLDTNAAGQIVPSFAAGAEYLIQSVVVPRLGFSEDRFRGTRELTAGVSVLVTGLAIEASYAHDLVGGGNRFGLALRLLDWML